MINKVQTVLDTALASSGVYSYWKRKTKTNGSTVDEYIVYTIGGDAATYADNDPLIRNANITIRYYYRDTLLDTSTGKTQIETRIGTIITALEGSGFKVPYGHFDAGDIDDTGFAATVIESFYGRMF
ncbi:MAG: hypothetical protein ACOX4U_00485 [Anaerovoracaceae bacterium]|jgi:hypothetical protein